MQITLDKKSMTELAEIVATSVVTALKQEGLVSANEKAKKTEKTAYQKTEQLLYNYKGFLKIVEEREREIEEIRKYGVPQSNAVKERVQGGSVARGIVLPEESVECAIRSVQESMVDTVRVIALIDKCMAAVENDPYYKILEMRYFENRTLEDIGAYFNCDHTTISRNKSRLVKALAMRLFPDEVVREFNIKLD